MKPQINIFVLLKCFLLSPSLWGQLSIFGDIYVSEENQLHIAFEDTYFNGGKIITEKKSITEGVVSFGSRSKWHQVREASYVAGSVRIYHEGEFTFPVGSNTNFSPITLYLLKNNDFVQVQYQDRPPHILSLMDTAYESPKFHYWSWKTSGLTTAKIKIYWWDWHRLDRLSFGQLNPNQLHYGLLSNTGWEVFMGHLVNNPFTEKESISLEYGGALLLEPFELSNYKGISFTLAHLSPTFSEKTISEVITPNNDGINDTWKIKGYSFSPKSRIRIYAIDGTLVYDHIGTYQNDWSGTKIMSSEKLPQGSYFYSIDLDGNLAPDLQGWVLIKYF